jgi:hypothetical protein
MCRFISVSVFWGARGVAEPPNIGYPKLFMGGKASAAKPLAAAAGE